MRTQFYRNCAKGVGGNGLFCIFLKMRRQVRQGNLGERASDQGWSVRIVWRTIGVFLDGLRIGAGTTALCRGDQKLRRRGEDRSWIPFSGNKAWFGFSSDIENRDGIGNGVGGEKKFFVVRERERLGSLPP